MGGTTGAPPVSVLNCANRYLAYLRRIILTLRSWLASQHRASGKIKSIMFIPPLTTAGAQTLGR